LETEAQKPDHRFVTGFLVLLFGLFLIRNAWVSDDAYITFRTIENFLAGYGIGYNPFLRVQAYTHPLWMFLLSILYFIQVKILSLGGNTGLYFLVTFLSIFLSCLTVSLLLSMKDVQERFDVKLLLGLAVILSKSFVDYSTSGLENPLTHILLLAFLWQFLSKTGGYFELALLTSLLALNRLDSVLFALPVLIFVFISDRANWRKNIKSLFLGLLPLVVWEIFSLFYYGFPFPNTAYAKLNTGIGKSLLVAQGIDYLLSSLKLDMITLLLIALAGIGIWMEKEKRLIAAYVGIIFYLGYLVWIGGDFMSGRFLSAPFIASLFLMTQLRSFSLQAVSAVAGIILLLGLTAPRSPIFSLINPHVEVLSDLRDENGISDDKLVYFERSSLMINGFRDAKGGSRYAGVRWIYNGTTKVSVEGAIGLFGYQQGPNVIVVDPLALNDALLARLPVKSTTEWRIGHFEREIPAGYLESLETSEVTVADPALAEYYKKLLVLVSGPLWDSNRLAEIWKFNTGQYDHLIGSYLAGSGN
jgi:arabinofuranosyltransferase